MIQYALKCDRDHRFESWFKSASAFETLATSGHLSCAVCGSPEVTKAVMAPHVTARRQATPADPRPAAETKLAALRAHIEKNADYVGNRFAQEARSIFSGDAPGRAIYGEANGAEARALIEDGVPVAPLPFTPKRKTN